MQCHAMQGDVLNLNFAVLLLKGHTLLRVQAVLLYTARLPCIKCKQILPVSWKINLEPNRIYSNTTNLESEHMYIQIHSSKMCNI